MQFVGVLIILTKFDQTSVDNRDIFSLAQTNQNIQDKGADARAKENFPCEAKRPEGTRPGYFISK